MELRPKTLKEMGFRVTEEYTESRSPYAAEIAAIAAKLPKKEFKPLSEAEILSMQGPSTRSKLLGTYDMDYQNQGDWKAVKDAETTDDAVGMGKRPVTPDELQLIQKNRIRPKNTQYGENRATSKKTKERAADVLAHSKGVSWNELTPSEKGTVTKLTPIAQPKAPPAHIPDKEGFAGVTEWLGELTYWLLDQGLRPKRDRMPFEEFRQQQRQEKQDD